MDRFGINVRDYYDITISHKGNFVVTYRIFIYSFILINSFTIEGVEINYSEDNIHVATWEHYDIAKDYNYVIDVYSDYTAILTYRGVKQSTLSGSLLFGGGNFFEIDIYDGNNYYVTTYDFILFVDINISDIFDSVTMDENQLYYGVSIWEVGNITQPSSVGAVGDYALYFDVKSGISVDLSIVGSDWTNGDNITLDSGKNEFVLVVSYGGYEYQFYLVFYAEYDRFYNWHGYEVEVRGEIAENSETLPSKADTQIIRVPAGYTVTEDDVNIIYDEEDESLLYEASIESTQIKITVKMADGGQIVGYIYVLMVIDGEVNDDAETFFMLRSFYNYAIEDESQDSLTKIEFTENGEGNFIAEVNIPDKSSFLYKKPYFAQAEITIDKSEGLELHEEIYFGSFGCKYLYSYIVVGEVGSTFTYSITVTSSSTLVTQTYTIIFTIIEPIYEFAFDFGQDFVEKFELFDLAPYLFSGEDMEIDLVLAELPQDAVSYNGEQIIVTFAIVSDRIYSYDQDMEEEVNIVNGSIVTFVLTKVGENVYAIPPFIYHLNYSERYDMEFAIVIRFIVEN